MHSSHSLEHSLYHLPPTCLVQRGLNRSISFMALCTMWKDRGTSFSWLGLALPQWSPGPTREGLCLSVLPSAQLPCLPWVSGKQTLELQSVLIIHGSHICKFSYCLKFIYNPLIDTHGAFTTVHAWTCTCSERWRICIISAHIPGKADPGSTLCSYFSFCAKNKGPFPGLLRATFCTFCWWLHC